VLLSLCDDAEKRLEEITDRINCDEASGMEKIMSRILEIKR
jgi:hypothetical protein